MICDLRTSTSSPDSIVLSLDEAKRLAQEKTLSESDLILLRNAIMAAAMQEQKAKRKAALANPENFGPMTDSEREELMLLEKTPQPHGNMRRAGVQYQLVDRGYAKGVQTLGSKAHFEITDAGREALKK